MFALRGEKPVISHSSSRPDAYFTVREPKPIIFAPHIFGGAPVASDISSIILRQSARAASSPTPFRKSSTLASVCLVFGSFFAIFFVLYFFEYRGQFLIKSADRRNRCNNVFDLYQFALFVEFFVCQTPDDAEKIVFDATF